MVMLCLFSFSHLQWRIAQTLGGARNRCSQVIENRVAKAEYELGFAPKFDTVIVNDDLETAKAEALKVILSILERMKQRESVQPVGTEEEE